MAAACSGMARIRAWRIAHRALLPSHPSRQSPGRRRLCGTCTEVDAVALLTPTVLARRRFRACVGYTACRRLQTVYCCRSLAPNGGEDVWSRPCSAAAALSWASRTIHASASTSTRQLSWPFGRALAPGAAATQRGARPRPLLPIMHCVKEAARGWGRQEGGCNTRQEGMQVWKRAAFGLVTRCCSKHTRVS